MKTAENRLNFLIELHGGNVEEVLRTKQGKQLSALVWLASKEKERKARNLTGKF